MKALNGIYDWIGGSGDTASDTIVAWKEGRPVTYGEIQDNAKKIRCSEEVTQYMEKLPKDMECNARLEEASRQFYKREAESQETFADIKRTKGQLIVGFAVGCAAVAVMATRIHGWVNSHCPHLG